MPKEELFLVECRINLFWINIDKAKPLILLYPGNMSFGILSLLQSLSSITLEAKCVWIANFQVNPQIFHTIQVGMFAKFLFRVSLVLCWFGSLLSAIVKSLAFEDGLCQVFNCTLVWTVFPLCLQLLLWAILNNYTTQDTTWVYITETALFLYSTQSKSGLAQQKL